MHTLEYSDAEECELVVRCDDPIRQNCESQSDGYCNKAVAYTADLGTTIGVSLSYFALNSLTLLL